MFNPFVKFIFKFIPRFRELKQRYLVSQTYVMALDHFKEENKTPILLTNYDNKNLALIHFNAVKEDKFASIIDLENEKHREKLLEMIGLNSNYDVYAAIVTKREEVEKRLNAKYTNNMRRFITKETTWRIGADKTIYPSFEVVFGEFFITLKYAGQSVRLKLADIEKY